MGKVLARLFLFLGILSMAASGYLQLYNRAENQSASDASTQILSQIKSNIEINHSNPETLAHTSDPETYIGYLSIPDLELELPVMNDWSYEKLKQTPCRFSGSLWEENLVVMAHNYEDHFGKLSTLSPGDDVYFVDSQGISVHYQIGAVEILLPSAVEEVTENDFDLTLFTCTYGGKKRVVVFCQKVMQK